MAATARACVLAAGKGTRMGGDRPKVLYEAQGRPLLHWVLGALSAVGIDDQIAVVGFGKDEVIATLPTGVRWVEQSPQLGTGHAVLQARSLFGDDPTPILVTLGDMPLIRAETFGLVTGTREREDAACVVLSVRIPRESRFGRVLRDEQGRVLRIVEARDCSPDELQCDQGNTGVMCFRPDALWSALDEITNDNAQGEYYLTDVIEILIRRGETVVGVTCEDADEGLGINTPQDLAHVEGIMQTRGMGQRGES